LHTLTAQLLQNTDFILRIEFLSKYTLKLSYDNSHKKFPVENCIEMINFLFLKQN